MRDLGTLGPKWDVSMNSLPSHVAQGNLQKRGQKYLLYEPEETVNTKEARSSKHHRNQHRYELTETGTLHRDAQIWGLSGRSGSGNRPVSLTQKLSPTDKNLQVKNSFALTESHCVYKPVLRPDPCPIGDDPHKTNTLIF